MSVQDKAPAIHILYSRDAEPQLLPLIEQMAYGVEEEGMTARITAMDFPAGGLEAVRTAAHRHCGETALGVVIGASKEGVVLHDKKMQEHCPVMTYKWSGDARDCRRIGQNAARLVKCKPFIALPMGLHDKETYDGK